MSNKVVITLEQLRDPLPSGNEYRIIGLKNTTEFDIRDSLSKAEVNALLVREDAPEVNIKPDKRF